MPSASACKWGDSDAAFASCVDTNLVYDNSVNDKSSWVQSSAGDLVVYWDLGSAQSVDSIKCTVGPTSGGTLDTTAGAQLAYSSNLSSWANYGSAFANGISTLTSYTISGGTISARYWRLVVTGNGLLAG
jgi:hypothetical protein